MTSEPLSLEDIPLGPFGGAELTLWGSRSGKVWHGDRECSLLKDPQRELRRVQPHHGTLADVARPGGLHCAHGGDLAAYLAAGRALLRFDVDTLSKEKRFATGDFDLSVFSENALSITDEHPVLTQAPLLESWERCLSRRRRLAEAMLEELSDRLPIVIAAAALKWRNKQRPKHHWQKKYDAFVEAAEREFTSLQTEHWDATKAGHQISRRHVLTRYLEKIEKGYPPAQAMHSLADQQQQWVRRVAEKDPTSPPEEIHAVWLRIGAIWEAMLWGVCAAHPGETFAIFHEDELPFPAPILHQLYPCARLKTTEFTWLAGSVPAVLRMMFRERRKGLLGLELDREHLYRLRDDRPALFLRNLVTFIGMPDLAEHVEDTASLTDRSPVDVDAENHHLYGFGEGIDDAGLTRWNCVPALQAAMKDVRFSEDAYEDAGDESWEDGDPDLEDAIAELLDREDSAAVLAAVQVRIRREQLAELRQVVERRSSSEADVQAVLEGAWWIFGGEYVGEFFRRRLVKGLELDIPLLKPDGVLHIVELKKPKSQIVKAHRGGLVLARTVHEGVGQVMNYLTLLDEHRSELLKGFEIDTRRASATVVVGHPRFEKGVEENAIHEALRILNSHLSRVEVITYKQLLDRAERNLDLTGRKTPTVPITRNPQEP